MRSDSPTPGGKRVVLVAAHARNRVIGNGPDIPWHLPHDFAHFKRETLGHTLVMGRLTWDSIGRPLPGRTTVVITRDRAFEPGFDGVLVAHSLEEALQMAAGLPGDVVVAGGGQVYAAAMPHATHQVLTLVDLEPAGDVLYPAYDPGDWVETRREAGEGCEWLWLERRRGPGTDPLRLSVDPHAGVAPYEQVKDAITARVDDGSLPPGFRLPPVRALAESLDLAANTVARAYKELEAAGVVETRGRAGTFVAGKGVERAARAAASAYVASARALGLSDQEALDLVRRSLGAG